MKIPQIALTLFFLLPVGISPCSATTDCDMAQVEFFKGKMGPERLQLRRNMKAIELCPGFIRPYELVGNIYRKNGQGDKALEYFYKADELGSRNYKMYYLMAKLLLEKGDLNGAHRHVTRSLQIRKNYPRSLELKASIEKKLDQKGPKILLFEPPVQRGLFVVQTTRGITVRGRATDKSGVAWVRINGLPADLDPGGNFLRDISLKPGGNSLQVEAADALENRTVITATIIQEIPKINSFNGSTATGGDSFYGKSVAVVIGINQYEKWPVLEYAVNDAVAVKQKLESTGFEQIILLTDQDATMRRILTVLWHDLPRMMDRNDRLLIFFAGHGQTEEKDGRQAGYIIPVDSDAAAFTETAISMEQLRNLSSRISAKHLLYVMDCCYSGLGLARSAGLAPGSSGYLRKVASKRAVQIVTAGGKNELAREKEGHGLFTAYFLKAIAGEADLNRDRFVTGTELGAFLRPAVSEASGHSQTPLYGRIEGEGEFIFNVKR
jgi:tetratricopeptide (TPR) repeat protein